VRGAVAYAISDGRDKLEGEIKKSSMLAKTKDQTAKLVLGSATVGAVISAATGNPFNAISAAAAAGSAALFILKDWFSVRRDQAIRQALMRHYAIWEQ